MVEIISDPKILLWYRGKRIINILSEIKNGCKYLYIYRERPVWIYSRHNLCPVHDSKASTFTCGYEILKCLGPEKRSNACKSEGLHSLSRNVSVQQPALSDMFFLSIALEESSSF